MKAPYEPGSVSYTHLDVYKRQGLVNKVVPLEQLEDEYVQWAEEMMLLSPLALRMIKAGLRCV